MNTSEKIYVYIPDDDIVGTASTQKGFPHQFVTEEYIRIDAFIEKACDAYCAICDTKECNGCSECTWVIKFRRQLLKY